MDQTSFPGFGEEGAGGKLLRFPLTRTQIQHMRALADGPLSAGPEFKQRTPKLRVQRVNTRNFADLSLADVKAILNRAEEGYTRDAADLWTLMLQDYQVSTVLGTLLDPIVQSRWEINPAEVSEDLTVAAELVAEGCEEALRGCLGFEEAQTALLQDGTGIGYGVAEIHWGQGVLMGQPAIVPKRIEPILARRFGWSDEFEIGLWDDGRAVYELERNGIEVDRLSGRGQVLARLPAGKYIVHTPRRIHNVPSMTGLMWSLAKWWWAKQVAYMAHLQGAEAHANPKWIALVDQATRGDDVMDELLEGMENWAADGYGVLKGATKIEQVGGNGTGSAQVYGGIIDRLDAAITKVGLGSTLNTEVGSTGGNRALGESQANETIDPRQNASASKFWRSTERDVLRYVVQWNPHIFLPGSPLPKGRSILAEDPVEVDDTAVSAGVVTVDELRESRGLAPLGGEQGSRLVQPQQSSAFGFTPPAPEVAASNDPFAVAARALATKLGGPFR